jgi:hypothetical protein
MIAMLCGWLEAAVRALWKGIRCGCRGCLLGNRRDWREDNRVYVYDLCDSPSLSYYGIYIFVKDVKLNGNSVISFVGFYASTKQFYKRGQQRVDLTR